MIYLLSTLLFSCLTSHPSPLNLHFSLSLLVFLSSYLIPFRVVTLRPQVLCCVGDHPLSSLSIDLRAHETAFACLVADAVCWSYRSRDHPCDLGIQNGGFIRQDMVYKPGTLLTRSTILDEMPFPRKAILIQLTLRQLRCGLEQMLQGCPAHVGSFPHLSADWQVK